MCTLTWLRREDGYELFFSRDESLQRLPAHAPTRTRRNGVEILAPRDADAGGTWLVVNAWGLTLGLLNGPTDGPQPPEPVSRGLLVSDLADARDADEVARRLSERDLAPHRPFELAALQPAAPLLRAVWDGRRLELSTLEDASQPLCSSSLDPLGAGVSRRALLERLRSEAGGLSEELLLAFHASHEPEPGGPSPCMHRDDAATVSFGRTRVTAGAVELGYSPAAPCARLPLTWLGLERLPLPGAPLPGERGPARRAPGP